MKSYRMLAFALVALAALLLAAVACKGDKKDGGDGVTPGAPAAEETAPPDEGDEEETPTPTEEPETDLNGRWEDGGREVVITHSGDRVTAEYVEPHTCDHADGTGEVSETDLDFLGTLDGDTITGSIQVCGYGEDNPLGVGFRPTDLTLTVSPDGQELSGTWFNGLDGTDVPITITRLD